MSTIAGMLAGIAAKVGAPTIKGILQKQLGDNLDGTLAGKIVNMVADKAGVEPEAIETVDEKGLESAVQETETEMPEVIELWQKGVEQQFDLMKSDEKLGSFNVFWRAGWMYLLGLFWIWRIVIVPAINAYGVPLEGIDVAVLATLTSWFMALYMGGHTLKELGKNVAESVKIRRRGDE